MQHELVGERHGWEPTEAEGAHLKVRLTECGARVEDLQRGRLPWCPFWNGSI
ncbi:hypothetical protein [Streptomyces sp. NPDC006510]|uniref:hypothetical protein n=1 Tax=Streptomyces sp. NPDC006510 TaxID=3155600 RepID=UPI0033B57A2D